MYVSIKRTIFPSQFNKKCLYTELPGPSRGYNQRSSTRLNCSQNPSAYLLETIFRVLPVESRQGHICRASIYATSVQGLPDAPCAVDRSLPLDLPGIEGNFWQPGQRPTIGGYGPHRPPHPQAVGKNSRGPSPRLLLVRWPQVHPWPVPSGSPPTVPQRLRQRRARWGRAWPDPAAAAS